MPTATALFRAAALRFGHQPRRCRGISIKAPTSNYDATIKNLKIVRNTRVIYQGFTGKAATVNVQQSIQYGTNVVGGMSPGKSGEHLGLPLFSSTSEAARHLKPDATAVFVAAPFAAAAIEEAIEAEIPLIVAVAEHVPLHDMLRLHSILRTQSVSRLVGANCPGIINPRGHCRIGFMPHPSFLPGSIGIVAKSGTLSYEAVASTTRVGLGQSLVVGMGGDPVAGTTLKDAVSVFLEDPETEGIVVIGEVGGSAELELADLLRRYRAEGGRKPIAGLVAGNCAVEGRVMGHAGAFTGVADPSVEDKIRALENVSVAMVQHPGQFGEVMLRLLGRPMPAEPVKGMGPNGPTQRRGMHTMARRPVSVRLPNRRHGYQRRSLYTQDPAVVHGLIQKAAPHAPVSHSPPTTPTFGLGVTIDRAVRSPCLVVIPNGSKAAMSYSFDFISGPQSKQTEDAFSQLNLPPSYSYSDFEDLVQHIWSLFNQIKAYTVFFQQVSLQHGIHLPGGVLMHLDHTQPLSAGVATTQQPEELEAAQFGIVYHTLAGEGSIGTLVNGAGLAMNTIDFVNASGGSVANFLDTGGKATGKTVVEGLRIVLADKRVKVVFVNIFGGLTDCTMIAQGILMAYDELAMQAKNIPIVVRLRGTNEEIGQELIRKSGLPVLAFDDLDAATEKVIALASATTY